MSSEDDSSSSSSASESSDDSFDNVDSLEAMQVAALNTKYEDIILGGGRTIDWVERLDVVSEQPTHVENVEDDLSRELAFYQQAMDAVIEGVGLLEASKIPWKRPEDYFAEMVKSDEHMQNIRNRLIAEKEILTKKQQYRDKLFQKKFGKAAQREAAIQRQRQTKSNYKAIEKFRKDRAKGLDVELPAELLEQEVTLSKKQRRLMEARKFKREARDAKWGHGGGKRRMKSNTAESASDMSEFYNNQTTQKWQRGTVHVEKRKLEKGKKRMGKSARRKTRHTKRRRGR